MEPEGRPVRGGKSPRSLAVKLTGVTDQNLPSKKSVVKKPVSKKKWPCKHQNAPVRRREGVQIAEERRHADAWRQTRN
jgi:hypothetical protein